MMLRSITDTVVPIKGKRPSGLAPERFSTEAGRVLWDTLGGKCLYISTVRVRAHVRAAGC